MANPVIVPVAKDSWIKVATNVTSGFIHIINSKPHSYLQTYRLTGVAAPTLRTEGIPFSKSKTEVISSSAAIDVYVYCVEEAGSVRVDV